MPDDPRVPERRQVRLDSDQLRCLAHPLRMRLLGVLRLEGPATSARLAQRLGTNTGATSYHLRQLADVGLVVEEEGRGTARERWWAAAHDVTVWADSAVDDDPDDRAAADWLLGAVHRERSRWREAWFRTRRTWSRAWRDAAMSGDRWLELSPAQLVAMKAEITAVLDAYDRRGPDPADEAERVMVVIEAVPFRELDL